MSVLGKKISDLDAVSATIQLAESDIFELSRGLDDVPFSNSLSLGLLKEYFDETFINKDEDTMFGPLHWSNLDEESASIDMGDDGTVNVFPEAADSIVAINGSSAAPGNTGQLITGRFRFCRPIQTAADEDVLTSGASGVATSVLRVDSALESNVLTIRKTDGTPGLDFQPGNFFSVVQEGTGQVVIEGEANVVLLFPADKLTTTRTQYSVITCTCLAVDEAGEDIWVVEGDLDSV
jgi:hypothetical protein